MKRKRTFSLLVFAVAVFAGIAAVHGQENTVTHELDLENFLWCSVGDPEKTTRLSTGRDDLDQSLLDEFQLLKDELQALRSEIEARKPLVYENQEIFTSTLDNPEPKLIYNLSYRQDLAALRQVNKYVFLDDERSQRDDAASFILTVQDNGRFPKSFSRNDRNITMNFHDNGALYTLGMVTGGTYYWFKWDENGQLLKRRESNVE